MTSTQEQAQEAAAQAKDKAGEVAGQAAQQARSRARQQVDERSTQAGARVSSTASDARQVADALREKGQEQPAKLAEQAADRAEKLGGYLQAADADRILSDVEDFGRRQPLAIVFGGLALGFAASRFLKASSEARYHAGGGNGAGSPSAHRSQPAATPALPQTTSPVAPPVPSSVDTPAHPGADEPFPAFPDPVVAPRPPAHSPVGGL